MGLISASKKVAITVRGYAENKVEKDLKPIKVVFDGKSPKNAARIIHDYLRDYLKEIGQTVYFWDSDDYREKGSEYGKVIIVGHHSLADKMIEQVGYLKYDAYKEYGMKYGSSGNICVLKASRKKLGYSRSDKDSFDSYYKGKIAEHRELAQKLNIPMTAGNRSSRTESQYDLLCLEFIASGLDEFLGIDQYK